MSNTTAAEMVELIREALGEFEDSDPGVTRTSTFDEAGLLTSNQGLVIRLSDGSEFQVTVVQSR